MLAGKTDVADAVVTVHEIDASSPVLALSGTVVDILIAVLAHPTPLAITFVIAVRVATTVGVDAGTDLTFVRV